MSTKYEPGTVGAYTLTSGTTNFVIRTGESCNLKCPYSGEHWHGHIGAVSGETVEIRRVLVIDPEDNEQTSALFHAADTTLGGFRENLRKMVAPPIEEPKGLGAVVESFEGSVWVRGHHNKRGWVRTAFDNEARSWDEIPTPLTVLHGGYTPEAES